MSSLEEAKRVMASGEKHLGDFVWWSLGGEPLRSRTRDALAAEGFDPALCADVTSPEQALGRAVRRLPDGWFTRRTGEGLLLAYQRDTKLIGLYELHAKASSPEAVPVHSLDATDWLVTQAQDAVLAIRDAAQRAEFTITASDLGSICVTVVDDLDGVRLKPQGHVYWVPAHNAHRVRALQRAVTAASCNSCHVLVTPVHDSPEARSSVKSAAAEQFQIEFARIEAELEAFAQRTPRESTLQTRLASYEALRQHVEVYADILDHKAQRLFSRLDAARDAVRVMIDESTDSDSRVSQ